MARPGRIYLALDCNYFDDSDVIELSDAAQLLDLRAMALMKRLQSDGRLTRRQLRRIAPFCTLATGRRTAWMVNSTTPLNDVELNGAEQYDSLIGAVVAELVDSGLWLDKGDELERRNWFSWNDSAEMVELMSRGGKKGNHVKWHVRRGQPDPECQFCIDDGLPPSPPESPPDRPGESPFSLHKGDVDVDPDTDTLSCAASPSDAVALGAALADACGLDQSEMTPSAQGAFNKALGDLMAVHASADEIQRRASAYHQRFPDATLTPPALAKHWPSLARIYLAGAEPTEPRDLDAEYYLLGRNLADKCEATFQDLVASKTTDPDLIEAAWRGRREALEQDEAGSA